MMFKTLSPQEEQEYRQWARENHSPGESISPVWHPVVRDECRKIDEAYLSAQEEE